MKPALLCLFACLMALPARAQHSPFSVGPQFSSLGFGVGASYFAAPQISFSAEASLMPVLSPAVEISGVDYDAEIRIGGGVLLANYHPGSGRFSLGAGVLVGGYGLEGTATPTEPVVVGGREYQPEEIGRLDGTLSVRGPRPTFLLGWRGEGLNFGLGVTGGYAFRFNLEANGPAASSAEFRQRVEQERQEIQDRLKRMPVLPYFRLGWQFGL